MKKPLSSFQLIIYGFLGLILVGTLLLMLPITTWGHHSAGFVDALFTATSATCVTGLVVHDTATFWNPFGQLILLILIQIGGLGVITVASFFALISGRKINLFQRNTLQEAFSAHKVGGIVRLMSFILKTSFLIEFIGMCLLAFVFIPQYGPLKGLWFAIFHSISAFCNAGFDLMGNYGGGSLAGYVDNHVVNFTIITLIIVGGLGFLTWDDIRTNHYRFHRYRLQSKLIFTMTGILILFPTLYFYFVEFEPSAWPMLTGMKRFWAALFQAVTPRTAGFNTVSLDGLSGAGQLLTIMLMLIGGSPGSTAGGMKTTTVAVLVLSAFSVFRQSENTQCFQRRIAESIVRAAAATFFMYFLLWITGGMLISIFEQQPIMWCLFESASAIGTVGLTIGITRSLSTSSKIILILLMFFGRVGGLTMIYATISHKRAEAKYPLEKVTVG